MMTASSVGMRWGASLLPISAVCQRLKAAARSPEVWHPMYPFQYRLRVTRRPETWLRADRSFNHEAPRSDTRHRDVRLQRVRTISERHTRDDVNHDATSDRKI